MNKQVTILPSQVSTTESLYIDSTLGDDTKIVITYTADIQVNVTTPNNNPVTTTKNPTLRLITVKIDGRVVSVLSVVIELM